jgi:hypothetical protein
MNTDFEPVLHLTAGASELFRQLFRFIVGRLSAGHSERPPKDIPPKSETDEPIVITVAIRRFGGPSLADVPPFGKFLPRDGERRLSVYPGRLFPRKFCINDRVWPQGPVSKTLISEILFIMRNSC